MADIVFSLSGDRKRPVVKDFHRRGDLFHRVDDRFHRRAESLGVSFFGQKCTWQTSYFSKSVTEKACRLKVFPPLDHLTGEAKRTPVRITDALKASGFPFMGKNALDRHRILIKSVTEKTGDQRKSKKCKVGSRVLTTYHIW